MSGQYQASPSLQASQLKPDQVVDPACTERYVAAGGGRGPWISGVKDRRVTFAFCIWYEGVVTGYFICWSHKAAEDVDVVATLV